MPMTSLCQRLSTTAAVVLLSLPLLGTVAASPARAAVDAEALADELLGDLDFRLVGPFRGGRVTAVAGIPGDGRTFYMGSTGGGVWKTTDAGLSWKNVSDVRKETDDEDAEEEAPDAPDAPAAPTPEGLGEEPESEPFGSASVGAIAVAPSDPNVVWVGMGSACIRGNTSPGDGVYRSTDAGKTWRHVGLPEAGQIGRIRVHPEDPDRAWVAALGHAFGPNPERGVYRTRDGGESWERVLFVSDTAGAVDLVLDPSNPRILYAAFWEAVRKPWTMISGGPGSGLYKSVDGGDSWHRLDDGLPEGILGRIGIAVSPADPDRIWALVEHAEKGGLYRSDDGGAGFRLVNPDRDLLQRPWYYTHVYADPADRETVYVLNVLMWRSHDGGESFEVIRTPHGDNHDLWIDPEDPRVMIEGNDGGANVSLDAGAGWSTQANQPTAEMYRVTVDDQFPYWLYGGQQDNSTVAIPSRTAGGGVDRQDWYAPGGCESGWVAVDPEDPDVTYAGCYGGTIGRFDRKLGQEQEVMAYPEMAVGQQAKDLEYRFQWNAPIRISPHDSEVLYHCSNHVHRSTDEGQSWTVISPDLSRDDESKQGYAGGPITWDNTGVEVYGTVFAFQESPHTPGELWAGSDDGLVHLSRDGGETWTEITPKGIPEWGTVNAIELSPHDPGRAFVAVHRYRLDDFSPYVFRTDDWGASWTRIADGSNGIPADHFVRVVREDPAEKGLLYAGTEFGLFVSFDDGASWRPLQQNLPVTPITDLAVEDGDLVVATQGRSYWILDDLTPLRVYAAEGAVSGNRLLPSRTAIQFGGGGGFGGGGSRGANPPYGAILSWVLAEDFSDEGDTEVVLEILDETGEVLRTLSSQEEERRAPNPWARFFPEAGGGGKIPAERGLNRWAWNLRLPDAHIVDDAVLWGRARGPEVAPGTYRARLTVGSWSGETEIEVAPDPRSTASAEEHRERFELARSIWERLTDSHDAIRTARSVRDQVESTVERIVGAGKGSEELTEAKDSLVEVLTEVETSVHQTKSEAGQDVLNFPPKIDNQLVFLQGVVETAGAVPTQGSRERFADLDRELRAIEDRLAEILATDLPRFNELAEAAASEPVVVPVAAAD